jgi:hypothetical protein
LFLLRYSFSEKQYVRHHEKLLRVVCYAFTHTHTHTIILPVIVIFTVTHHGHQYFFHFRLFISFYFKVLSKRNFLHRNLNVSFLAIIIHKYDLTRTILKIQFSLNSATTCNICSSASIFFEPRIVLMSWQSGVSRSFVWCRFIKADCPSLLCPY